MASKGKVFLVRLGKGRAGTGGERTGLDWQGKERLLRQGKAMEWKATAMQGTGLQGKERSLWRGNVGIGNAGIGWDWNGNVRQGKLW